jgi:tetratricopeptide (TPR) repeat protein
MQEHDYDTALVLFRDALRFASHPEWKSLTHFRLGQLRHLQDREDDAIEEYLLAKSLISPESQRSLFLSITNALGDSYFATGQKELAISAYREVLQVDPADAHALDMLEALER